jgi:hypothetical protein
VPPFLPKENGQAGSAPTANEITAETSKAEKQFVGDDQTPNVDDNHAIAEAEVFTENPQDAKSQQAATTADKSGSQTASADKNSAQAAQAADANEPFAFGKCTINLNLILLPSPNDGNGRKAIISATSHKLPPEIELLEIGEFRQRPGR